MTLDEIKTKFMDLQTIALVGRTAPAIEADTTLEQNAYKTQRAILGKVQSLSIDDLASQLKTFIGQQGSLMAMQQATSVGARIPEQYDPQAGMARKQFWTAVENYLDLDSDGVDARLAALKDTLENAVSSQAA